MLRVSAERTRKSEFVAPPPPRGGGLADPTPAHLQSRRALPGDVGVEAEDHQTTGRNRNLKHLKSTSKQLLLIVSLQRNFIRPGLGLGWSENSSFQYAEVALRASAKASFDRFSRISTFQSFSSMFEGLSMVFNRFSLASGATYRGLSCRCGAGAAATAQSLRSRKCGGILLATG